MDGIFRQGHQYFYGCPLSKGALNVHVTIVALNDAIGY
jgi:hypothetical protein